MIRLLQVVARGRGASSGRGSGQELEHSNGRQQQHSSRGDGGVGTVVVAVLLHVVGRGVVVVNKYTCVASILVDG